MRKLVTAAFVTLDGVMQAPGGPEEDPTGGFTLGGWTVNYWDEAMGQVMGIVTRPGQTELMKTLNDFVARNKANGELGKLYQKWLGTDFPTMPNS